jgi:NitT/TauT family transport system permease protein/taurine transport system permease protein
MADAVVQPIIAATFPIPKIALLPLLILWLGIGEASKVAVIMLGVFFPMAINTYTGVRHIDPTLIEAARVHGAHPARLLREVLLPGALPMIFTGLRLSMQACWTTLVAGELIGAVAGLGHVLYQASLDLFPAMIVVGMAAGAATGAAMTALLGWIERRAMPWRART